MLMQLHFTACQISSVALQAPLKAPFDARRDGMEWFEWDAMQHAAPDENV